MRGELQSTHAGFVSAEVGPGFGRAWSGVAGGSYAVVNVDDYGIVVHLRHVQSCRTVNLNAARSADGAPLFFVGDS